MNQKTAAFPFDGEVELGVSPWHQVTQEQVDQFAKVSLDPDPMHVDPEWAKANSPFGQTIVFGFQTLSLLTYFAHQVIDPLTDRYPALKYALNYGFDRVRLVAPVPVGARLRGRFKITDAQPKGDGGTLVTMNAAVEIEGQTRPALVADWLWVAVPVP